MFDNLNNIQKRIEKISGSLDKINKQLSLFSEDGSSFVDVMELDDIDKIDKDYIIQMLPELIKSETLFMSLERKVDSLVPVIVDTIDFI